MSSTQKCSDTWYGYIPVSKIRDEKTVLAKNEEVNDVYNQLYKKYCDYREAGINNDQNKMVSCIPPCLNTLQKLEKYIAVREMAIILLDNKIRNIIYNFRMERQNPCQADVTIMYETIQKMKTMSQEIQTACAKMNE